MISEYCISFPTLYSHENVFLFFSSRRRHTRYWRDWSSDVCSSDLTTTISPSGDSKKDPDPTRIGTAPFQGPLAPERLAEPRVIIPAIHISPERPTSPPGP